MKTWKERQLERNDRARWRARGSRVSQRTKYRVEVAGATYDFATYDLARGHIDLAHELSSDPLPWRIIDLETGRTIAEVRL